MDPFASAFRYGAGFFETLYYNGKKVCHLDTHLDRLLHSLRAYQIEHETIDFASVIEQVLRRNELEQSPARVNIFYPMEDPLAHPVVLAVPHEPKPYKAYRVCLCKDRHVSSLNTVKTTSYMFFHLALKQARARGFDDTALTDFDNTLLETTTGALLFEKAGEFFETDTPYKLPSTALGMAREVLEVRPRRISIDDMGEYRHAYILNSVIGMRPVVAVAETAFVPDEEACRKVTEAVLEE